MLADFCTNNRIKVFCVFIKFFNYSDRAQFAFVFFLRGAFFLPLVDLFAPRLFDFVVYLVIIGVKLLEHGAHNIFCVPDNGDVYFYVFVDRTRVNINVDNLCVFCKTFEAACYTVIKTCSDSKEHVAVCNSIICPEIPVHTEHSKRALVSLGKSAFGHERVCDGDI